MLIVPMLDQGGLERVCATTAQLLKKEYCVSLVVFNTTGMIYDVSGVDMIDLKLGAVDGKIKKAEIHTGGITEYLCKKCNCYGIIRNYNELDDPNYDNFGVGLAYKEQILKIVKEKNIKLVLDIHGCNSQHNFDFDNTSFLIG